MHFCTLKQCYTIGEAVTVRTVAPVRGCSLCEQHRLAVAA